MLHHRRFILLLFTDVFCLDSESTNGISVFCFVSLSLHIMCVLGFSASFGNYGQRCVPPVLHSLPARSVAYFYAEEKIGTACCS